MNKKVLLVATVQSHIGQFHKPLINMLKEEGYEVHVAARDNLAEKNGLTIEEADRIFDVPFARSPYSFKNLKAYRMLKKIILKNNYSVLHCNTPVGGILSRIACKKLRKKGSIKVIYQAHGFHFYEGCPLSNKIWYPIEKFFSKYTDILVTINKMDYEIARKNFKARKTEYIVGGVGVSFDRFTNTSTTGIKNELGLSEENRIILSVGELNKNKNHKAIIKALSILNDENIHYLIAGNGPLYDELKNYAKECNVNNRVHLLGYRRDIPSLCNEADVFAFPSYREGLGLAAIEAMSTGLPIVTSDRHGINDYSINGLTGYKYGPDNYKGFADGIKKIVYDKSLKEKMGKYNIELAKKFSVENALGCMKEIYKIIDTGLNP